MWSRHEPPGSFGSQRLMIAVEARACRPVSPDPAGPGPALRCQPAPGSRALAPARLPGRRPRPAGCPGPPPSASGSPTPPRSSRSPASARRRPARQHPSSRRLPEGEERFDLRTPYFALSSESSEETLVSTAVGPYSHGGSHGPPSTSRRIAGQLSESRSLRTLDADAGVLDGSLTPPSLP